MLKAKQILNYVLKNILFLLFSVLVSFGKINSIINPFFQPLIFALVATRLNVFNFIFGACVGQLIYDFSVCGFAEMLLILCSSLLLVIASKKTKHLQYLSFLALVCTATIQFVFYAISSEALILCIVNLVLKAIVFYTYYSLFNGIKVRGVRTRLLVDEFIGLVFLIMPVSITLFKLSVLGVNIGLIFAAFLICFVAVSLGPLEAITVAVILGLGVSVVNANILMLAALPLWAACVSLVKRAGRVVMVIMLLLVDVILGLYFNVYASYNKFNLLGLVIAGLIFVLLPKKIIKKVSLMFSSDGLELSTLELFKMEEQEVVQGIQRLSGLFFDIHSIYDNLVMGALNKKEISATIKHNIIEKNCIKCIKRSVCYDANYAAEKSIGELVNIATSKNRVRVVDIPLFLATNCGKANQIMFAINAYLEEFNKYNKEIKKEDEGKLMVSNQLLNISDILKKFTTKNILGKRESKDKEQALIDELLYNNIIVKECAVFSDSNIIIKVLIVIKNKKYKRCDVVKIVNRHFKQSLEIAEIKYAKKSGYNIVTMLPKSKYDYAVGSYKISKENVCGDGTSVVKIDHSRVIVSLADGKGHGPKANRLSEMALTLIEKFYMAGYSSQVIMENVNKVLSFKGGENFSAVDVCLLNLESGAAEIIKRGGTPTVIKHTNGEAVAINSSCLPVGLVENAKTEITTNYVSRGDVLVFSSDGVFDAFDSTSEFVGFVNNINERDMNKFSKILAKEAIKRNSGQIRDDMTVIALQIV